MKLSEVQTLLVENSIDYKLTTEPSRAGFYRKKGFQPIKDTGAFCLLTIPNPNHKMDAQIIFADATDNPDFYDLEFGGYWYELFDCGEEHLKEELLNEIQQILNGRTHVIFATNANTGNCFFDGMYDNSPEKELNSMDAFRKTVEKIKSPKSWWKKLTGRTDAYEIFNWHNYEKVVK